MDLLLKLVKLLWDLFWAFLQGTWAIIYGIGLGLWNNPILIIGIIIVVGAGIILHRIFKHRH